MTEKWCGYAKLGIGYLTAVLLAGVVGCGGSQYTSVSGTVTLDDNPLADANVVFQATGLPMATARTDGNGRFRVETGGANGMVPGEYQVTVAAFETAASGKGRKLPKLIVPEKYVKPDQSGLKATIEEGDNADLIFALSGS